MTYRSRDIACAVVMDSGLATQGGRLGQFWRAISGKPEIGDGAPE
jgi:hypothetical protein